MASANTRKDMIAIAAIALGLLIGFFIKRLTTGLLIGLVLGIVGGGLLGRRK
jgi:hypothetical protein